MPTYKNHKPSIIGLNHQSGEEPRLVQPGEVFSAEQKDIPESLLASGWVKPTNETPAPKLQANAPRPAAAPGLNSSADFVPDASPSDQQAAASGAYTPGSSPAEREAARKAAGEGIDPNAGTPDVVTPVVADAQRQAGSSSTPSSAQSASTPPSSSSSDDDAKSGKKHK